MDMALDHRFLIQHRSIGEAPGKDEPQLGMLVLGSSENAVSGLGIMNTVLAYLARRILAASKDLLPGFG